MASISIKVPAGEIRKAVKQRCTDPIIALTKNRQLMRDIGEKIIEILDPYVPEDSGELKDSAHVVFHEKQFSVKWDADHARYQHEGEVYGPNIPITVDKGSRIVGWYSRKPKYATGRELGVPHVWKGWKFGYTKSGTEHHWTKEVQRGTPGFEELVDYTEPLIKKEVK